jgi:hypothetical protein
VRYTTETEEDAFILTSVSIIRLNVRVDFSELFSFVRRKDQRYTHVMRIAVADCSLKAINRFR